MSLKPKGKRSILNRQLPQWCSGGSREEKEHFTFCAQAFLRNPGSSVPHSWKTGLETEEPALIFLSLFLTQKGSDSIAQDYWWGRNRIQTFPLLIWESSYWTRLRQGHLRGSRHLGSMGTTGLPPHLSLVVQKWSSEVPCRSTGVRASENSPCSHKRTKRSCSSMGR